MKTIIPTYSHAPNRFVNFTRTRDEISLVLPQALAEQLREFAEDSAPMKPVQVGSDVDVDAVGIIGKNL